MVPGSDGPKAAGPSALAEPALDAHDRSGDRSPSQDLDMPTGKFQSAGHTRGMSRTDSRLSNTAGRAISGGAEDTVDDDVPFPRPEAEAHDKAADDQDGGVQLAPGSEHSERLAGGSQGDQRDGRGTPSQASERDMLRVGSTGLGGMAQAVRSEDSHGDPFDDSARGTHH